MLVLYLLHNYKINGNSADLLETPFTKLIYALSLLGTKNVVTLKKAIYTEEHYLTQRIRLVDFENEDTQFRSLELPKDNFQFHGSIFLTMYEFY